MCDVKGRHQPARRQHDIPGAGLTAAVEFGLVYAALAQSAPGPGQNSESDLTDLFASNFQQPFVFFLEAKTELDIKSRVDQILTI